ncbi:MAG: PQQ-dependent sugar dehydrogenase [Botrimarina sp.]
MLYLLIAAAVGQPGAAPAQSKATRSDDLLNDSIDFAGFHLALRPYARLPESTRNIIQMTTRPGGDRLHVVTENGVVFALAAGADGAAQPEPWFDAREAVESATGRRFVFDGRGQRGLQSLAFHPGFDDPSSRGYGKLYTTYLEERPDDTGAHRYLGPDDLGGESIDGVLAEWTYDHESGEVEPASRRELFRVQMPEYDHPIKLAQFNPHAEPDGDDYGLLYVTHGDSNVKHSPDDDAQHLDNALGKMLRIDPLETDSAPYGVPASNPFADAPDARALREIYAYGFRNPHTFSFHRDSSNAVHLLVGDIGRNNIEEVDLVVPGGNYGWPEREGTFAHRQAPPGSENAGYLTGVSPIPDDEPAGRYRYPVAQYDHDAPRGVPSSGNAIATGAVVRSRRNRQLHNQFLFTDFSTVRGASVREGEVFACDLDDMLSAVTTLGDPDSPPSESDRLRQAAVSKVRLWLDHDLDPTTPPQVFDGFVDLLATPRTDVRIGVGPSGEVYFSSKQNGAIYLATDTLPQSKREPD